MKHLQRRVLLIVLALSVTAYGWAAATAATKISKHDDAMQLTTGAHACCDPAMSKHASHSHDGACKTASNCQCVAIHPFVATASAIDVAPAAVTEFIAADFSLPNTCTTPFWRPPRIS